MGFSDSDFVALNLPPDTSFSRNGVTITVADAITAALADGGTKEAALCMLFQMLEADQYQSEHIGRWSYEHYKMRGSDFWRLQGAGGTIDQNPPNVIGRPRRQGWPGNVGGGYW